MARGFGVFERAAAGGDRTEFVLHKTSFAAIGTGLMSAEPIRLQLGRGLERTSSQPAHGGDGDLLHCGEVDVETWTIVSICLTRDDLSPLATQLVDSLEIFRREFVLGHVVFFLELTPERWGDFPITMLTEVV